MSLATIFVPLSGTADDRVALATAFAVAKPFGAHIGAVCLTPHPGEVVTAGDLYESSRARAQLALQLREAARESFAAEAARAGAKIASAAQESGTLTASYREATGQLTRCIVSEAQFADLIVYPPLHGQSHSQLHDAFIEVLMKSGQPVLLCAQQAPLHRFARIAAGWDDGLPAAHALVAAMPLIENAASVELLTVGRGPSSGSETSEALEYLRLHGVAATARPLPRGAAGRALLAAAEGCDLLVIGGYGHSQMLETVFGGVTDFIASHAAIPILMAH